MKINNCKTCKKGGECENAKHVMFLTWPYLDPTPMPHYNAITESFYFNTKQIFEKVFG